MQYSAEEDRRTQAQWSGKYVWTAKKQAQSRGKTPEPGQHVLSVWFSTIASGKYNSELDDGMYDKSFIDDYGYIDRYTLSELGIEYSDAGTLHYFIFVDDAAYSRILQLFSNMHGGVADA